MTVFASVTVIVTCLVLIHSILSVKLSQVTHSKYVASFK